MKMLTSDEIAKKLNRGTLIALACRNDEENTKCAVEVCKKLNDGTNERIIYFSLKETKESFVQKYPDVPAEILDTAAIEVERLVEIVEKKNSKLAISMLVIDYLMLLSSRVNYASRKEEIDASVRLLSKFAKRTGIPILILTPLSKYTSKEVSIIEEVKRDGYMPELLDAIGYVREGTNNMQIQLIKDENSYVHYGDNGFVREKFKPIENNDFSNKPNGGLWASSCNAENVWSTWCVDNNFKIESLDKRFYFRIADTASVLRIESLEDCKELTLQPVGYMHKEYLDTNYKVIDYKACMERGIDAIEYKYDIASRSKGFEEIDSIMWGWDCDSILILNPDIVLPYE